MLLNCLADQARAVSKFLVDELANYTLRVLDLLLYRVFSYLELVLDFTINFVVVLIQAITQLLFEA